MTKFVNALLGGTGEYGIGLQKFQTDCGTAWGHIGQIAGYTTMTVSDGTRALSTGINTPVIADGAGSGEATKNFVNQALCG
ncbi:hypothetical protein [Amycolatopsis antarctica]|nr:hypothetical protein [Amycolatopsis antarctica]